MPEKAKRKRTPPFLMSSYNPRRLRVLMIIYGLMVALTAFVMGREWFSVHVMTTLIAVAGTWCSGFLFGWLNHQGRARWPQRTRLLAIASGALGIPMMLSAIGLVVQLIPFMLLTSGTLMRAYPEMPVLLGYLVLLLPFLMVCLLLIALWFQLGLAGQNAAMRRHNQRPGKRKRGNVAAERLSDAGQNDGVELLEALQEIEADQQQAD